jgi:hypothetical protein
VQFYDSFFITIQLAGLAYDSIDAEDEVLEVVKGMNSDKASGSNGFFIAFFQACWDVIKANIMGVLYDFHASSKFEKSLTTTFIALISKKSETIDLKDYQPINLVSGVYKIIAKVLVNRLRRVVKKIISKPQVKGR